MISKYQKAFDTLDHQILLKKLSYYGIKDNERQTLLYSNSPTKLTDGPKLYKDNTEIAYIHEFKFIGIRLDEQQLSFKYQIAHIRGKVAIIYNSLIKPHIEYGAAIWGPKVTTTMIKPLITLKKKAIRNICNTAYNSHTEALKKTLNFLQKCPP